MTVNGRRVVITAASAITPIGHTKEEIVAGLTNGVSGVIKLRENADLIEFIHSKVFGTVDYDIEFDFKRKYRKTMGPVAYYACQVAKEVLAQSGLESEFISSGRMGVAFGSIHGCPSITRNVYRRFYSGSKSDFATIGAVDYLKSMVHTTAVNITKMFGITGRVISSSTACTTSSQSIGYGYESIKYGMQDAMLCGGADEYDTATVAVFDNLLACSTDFNDTPHLTPRPFDVRRDGLVVGEGGGAVLLEDYEFAKKRGANILGEVIGYTCNNNGGDMILPNAHGVSEAIRTGIESAGISPEDVDFISAHATATKMGDVVEAQAIHKIYGDKPLVSGLKSYMGHTMAACGAIETVLALYMMDGGFVAPTLNLDDVDERCAMIRHATRLREEDIRIATIQNFAFGGVNTTLFIKKFE
jgi:3-oxoacyl-[acyl-carrier-protein] synthase II